ncbi:hypothetical protein ACFWPU_00605 [Streptomyces sp. NPDC058471]|uniref:hypothetical protein n=1 Tax=Streptomyces sp. NPDC058471 TaxID=3346516 RepID=UPI003667EBE7
MTEETTKRRGPKPNPFARLERARAKADRARAAYAKVTHLAAALDDAEREEQDALDALQDAVNAANVNA